MKRISILGLASLLCNAGGLVFLLNRPESVSRPAAAATRTRAHTTVTVSATSAAGAVSGNPSPPAALPGPTWVVVPKPQANIGQVVLTEKGDVAGSVVKALQLSGAEVRQINHALAAARSKLFAAEIRDRRLLTGEEGEYYLLPPNPAVYSEIRQSLTESLGCLRTPAWAGPVVDLLMADCWFLGLLTSQRVSFVGDGQWDVLEYSYTDLIGTSTGAGTAVNLADFPTSYIAQRYGHLFKFTR